ncbi:phosphatases II [Terfezia boudieri ATCC MYA-4762]|uniref:Phosphatases II n=1 Tax=Terfezia boudieri ATCC MYA-4762 TaxID=1051890 RepID=A0A3N4LGC1_9PEZI|nr:phosphatases II [Terfezia boudieri ATCC MYA-4762]
MELIRVAKVEQVSVVTRGVASPGTLHLTPHHLIFRYASSAPGAPAPKNSAQMEMWITYPIIQTVQRQPMNSGGYAALRIRCRDFNFITFHFTNDRECRDVFERVRALTVGGSLEKLYAFFFTPPPPERAVNGWKIYDSLKEYQRLGVGGRTNDWRISKINNSYTFCPTYPAHLVVPANISDNVLNYAGKYRSRARIPVLTYIHSINNCTITRSSQPLTGLKGNRSPQDEKLVAAIFSSTQASSFTRSYQQSDISPARSTTSLDECTMDKPRKAIYGAQQRNLIVDARPTVNAYAMQAMGLGSENMDNYRNCSKQYLGIDNIHVMRESLAKVVEAIKDSDLTPLPPNRELLAKSGWLKHIGLLLDGTQTIVRQIEIEHSHVLIHCSDGWDRTSQLSALAQLCLDPYYRTIEGFMVLVEKDWVSFGHRFRDRSGFLSSEKWFTQVGNDGGASNVGIGGAGSGGGGGSGGLEQAFSQAKMFFTGQGNGGRASPASVEHKVDADTDYKGESSSSILVGEKVSKHTASTGGVNIKEISPVFHQFLDATYQIMYQYPTRFEFNERFLRRLLYHLYSCQYGTFLYNNEKERVVDHKIASRTRSVWDYFLGRRHMWVSEKYDKSEDSRGWSVLFPKGIGYTRWWSESWCRTDEEMNGRYGPAIVGEEGGAELLSTGGFNKGIDDGVQTDEDGESAEEIGVQTDDDVEEMGVQTDEEEIDWARDRSGDKTRPLPSEEPGLVRAVGELSGLALSGLSNNGEGNGEGRDCGVVSG